MFSQKIKGYKELIIRMLITRSWLCYKNPRSVLVVELDKYREFDIKINVKGSLQYL